MMRWQRANEAAKFENSHAIFSCLWYLCKQKQWQGLLWSWISFHFMTSAQRCLCKLLLCHTDCFSTVSLVVGFYLWKHVCYFHPPHCRSDFTLQNHPGHSVWTHKLSTQSPGGTHIHTHKHTRTHTPVWLRPTSDTWTASSYSHPSHKADQRRGRAHEIQTLLKEM